MSVGLSVLEKCKGTKILVVGDLIVDKYIFCTALGASQEAPVLVIKRLNSEKYIGGAGVVSEHIRSLGGQSKLITVIGADGEAKEVLSKMPNAICFKDKSRPTTLKIRLIADGQKLLRVSILEEHYINEQIENSIKNSIIDEHKKKKIKGIVVSDFNYGVITATLLAFIKSFAKENNIMLFGDTQSSSQIGDVAQYNGYDLITPTEKEARIALADEQISRTRLARKLRKQTDSEMICLTLGSDGFLFIDSEGAVTYQTINKRPVDTAGAGDALLAALSLALASGVSHRGACELANIVASVHIEKEGNFPVSKKEVKRRIKNGN